MIFKKIRNFFKTKYDNIKFFFKTKYNYLIGWFGIFCKKRIKPFVLSFKSCMVLFLMKIVVFSKTKYFYLFKETILFAIDLFWFIIFLESAVSLYFRIFCLENYWFNYPWNIKILPALLLLLFSYSMLVYRKVFSNQRFWIIYFKNILHTFDKRFCITIKKKKFFFFWKNTIKLLFKLLKPSNFKEFYNSYYSDWKYSYDPELNYYLDIIYKFIKNYLENNGFPDVVDEYYNIPWYKERGWIILGEIISEFRWSIWCFIFALFKWWLWLIFLQGLGTLTVWTLVEPRFLPYGRYPWNSETIPALIAFTITGITLISADYCPEKFQTKNATCIMLILMLWSFWIFHTEEFSWLYLEFNEVHNDPLVLQWIRYFKNLFFNSHIIRWYIDYFVILDCYQPTNVPGEFLTPTFSVYYELTTFLSIEF